MLLTPYNQGGQKIQPLFEMPSSMAMPRTHEYDTPIVRVGK